MWVFGGNAYSEKFRESFRISAKSALQIWFGFSVSCSVHIQWFRFSFLRSWIRRIGCPTDFHFHLLTWRTKVQNAL